VEEGPPAVIREIKFEGNKVLTDDELRSQLKLVSEMSHDVFDRPTLEYDLIKVRNFMRSRGYLKAKVLDLKLTALNGNFTVVVPVEEGKLFRIGKIIIRDSMRFSPEQIVGMSGLKRGDIADGRRISEVLFEELKTLYGNMGYAQYSSEIDPEYRDNPNIENEGIVDFRITIIEGVCFKIQSVKFDGNQKLTEQYLRRFLLFKEGDTYNQQLVKDSLGALSESDLLERVDVKIQTDEDAGLMDITFKVVEYTDN
jgi:outer membrane protein insertion porin family